MLTIRAFQSGDAAAVVTLWERCALVKPQNDPWKDIARKTKVRPELFRVGLVDGRIVGTVMVGYEGHRGWINYLAVSPEYQGRGFGRQLMDEAERLLRAEGCPKINLMVRRSNAEVTAFYRALGYAMDDVISLGKRLEHDHDSARTA
jgi:ribosomal protein S18 acetylase RimI-like enzyme